jgi:hypothetical protein
MYLRTMLKLSCIYEEIESRVGVGLDRWDCGFESHLRHGCLSLSLFVVLSCVGRAFRQADPPSKESYQLSKRLIISENNSESEQVTRPNQCD